MGFRNSGNVRVPLINPPPPDLVLVSGVVRVENKAGVKLINAWGFWVVGVWEGSAVKEICFSKDSGSGFWSSFKPAQLKSLFRNGTLKQSSVKF